MTKKQVIPFYPCRRGRLQGRKTIPSFGAPLRHRNLVSALCPFDSPSPLRQAQGKRAWLQYNNGVFAVDNYFSVGLELTPGLVYFITPKFGIEGTLGSLAYEYRGIKLKGYPEAFKNYNVNLNLSNYYLGLNYYF